MRKRTWKCSLELPSPTRAPVSLSHFHPDRWRTGWFVDRMLTLSSLLTVFGCFPSIIFRLGKCVFLESSRIEWVALTGGLRSSAPTPSHWSALHSHPMKLGSTWASISMCVELNKGFLIVISLSLLKIDLIITKTYWQMLPWRTIFKGRNHLIIEAELTALDTGQKGTVSM